MLRGGWLVVAIAACSPAAKQSTVVGPQLGESTAPGPSDPTRPPPDAAGVTEVSAVIHGQMTAVPNPVTPTVSDTTSATPTGQPAGTTTDSNGAPATVFAPGVAVPTTGAPVTTPTQGGTTTTATTPSSAGASPGTGTAGPNGPGTGNGPATSVAPTGAGTPAPTSTTPAPTTTNAAPNTPPRGR